MSKADLLQSKLFALTIIFGFVQDILYFVDVSDYLFEIFYGP